MIRSAKNPRFLLLACLNLINATSVLVTALLSDRFIHHNAQSATATSPVGVTKFWEKEHNLTYVE